MLHSFKTLSSRCPQTAAGMQGASAAADGIELQAPSYVANALSRAGLQLRRVPGKRFGVFASRAFAAGSSILTEEPAACCVARNIDKVAKAGGKTAVSPVACARCMCDDKPLMACTACGIAHYCCKEHQKEHWPTHKPLCARLKIIPKEQLQQAAWAQHFSTMCMCTELMFSTRANPASASRPSSSDIMFLCAARPAPGASAVTSALSQMLGDEGRDGESAACVCCDSNCRRTGSSHTSYPQHPDDLTLLFAVQDFLMRIPRNAFTVLSPTGAAGCAADCRPFAPSTRRNTFTKRLN
jgi:hypothetical protein